MSNIVKVKDFTYNDLKDYANKRASDGNWSTLISIVVLSFVGSIPKGSRKKKDNYIKENIGECFNLKDYPDMCINIDTGEIYKNDDKDN